MPITITINGQTLSVEPGMTVLEAARANGIYIPTLCYAPKLPPFGGCRMCVVEIDRMPGMPTACTVPVADGMVVHSETPTVQAQRRETLALLLSEHPYTCLTCKNSSGCIEFQGTIRKAAVTTGCQYCPKNGQCEIQTVLQHVCLPEVPYPISYRGLPVEHDDPFFDRDMNLCIVCSRCVRACQDIRHANILALVERGNRTIVGTASGRPLLESGCQFCGACVDACPTGALFDKKSKWEGVPQTIVPSICPYCAVGCAVNIQARNGRVLRAVGHDDGVANDGEICVRGRFGVVDIVHNQRRLKTPLMKRGNRLVSVTWDVALDRIAQEIGQYRGDQFAVIASATATNEELFVLQKFARTIMHSNNVAIAAAPPNAATIAMMRAGSAPIREVRKAVTILVIGANPFESHPIVGLEMRHALSKGAQLITIDPRRTVVAKQAHRWLQPRVETDHVLLSAVLTVLDSKDVQISLDKAATTTGVSPDAIRAAAKTLTEHKPVVIIYGSGVTHQPQAEEILKTIRSLAVMLDAGVIGLAGEGNLVGTHDMGLHPALLPGYVSAEQAGRDYRSILEGVRTGQVKALYMAGDMPPLPELASVSYLVVQATTQSEILKHAQVVLPTTTFVEMDGTMTNLEGRVQRICKVIEPVGQAQAGWQIVQSMARRLGADWQYASAADVLLEIASSVPAYSGISQETLGVAGQLRRFEPAPPAQIELFSLDNPRQITSPEFPLVLLTEHNLLYYRGVSLVDVVTGLGELKKEKVLHIGQADAARLGVGEDRLVKVTSANGSDYWVPRIDDNLPAGTVFVSINPVVGSPVFPDMTPNNKAYAVRVEASE